MFFAQVCLFWRLVGLELVGWRCMISIKMPSVVVIRQLGITRSNERFEGCFVGYFWRMIQWQGSICKSPTIRIVRLVYNSNLKSHFEWIWYLINKSPMTGFRKPFMLIIETSKNTRNVWMYWVPPKNWQLPQVDIVKVRAALPRQQTYPLRQRCVALLPGDQRAPPDGNLEVKQHDAVWFGGFFLGKHNWGLIYLEDGTPVPFGVSGFLV